MQNLLLWSVQNVKIFITMSTVLLQIKKDSYRLAIFLGEGIFTMGYSKNYI